MAAYCFLCDAPVDGDACPTCGRPPTWVDDDVDTGPGLSERIRSIPGWVWPLLALVLAAAAFSLMRAGWYLPR